MKRLILVLVTVGLVSSCTPRIENNQETLNAQKNKLTELEKEEKLRRETNHQYLAELSKCSQNINAVSDFNGKTEFWQICKTDKTKRIIQISSYEEDSLYKEVYYEQNGELIYAEESIKYMPINHYVLQPWICQFYIEKGKIISLMSLGHGKTEDDEWKPEIIFEMYKKRIEELNKIL